MAHRAARCWILGVALLAAAAESRAQAKITTLQQVYQMKQVMPALKTIGVLADAAASKTLLVELARAGQTYDIEIVAIDVRDVRDVSRRFADLTGKYRVQLLWLANDTVINNPMAKRYLVTTSLSRKIPTFAPDRKGVEEGATFTVTLDDAGQILTVVNQKSEELLGISLPAEVLVQKL